MKKLFLFLAVAGFAVSCSKDDDNGGSDTLKFKIDGVQKSMSNIVVNEEPNGDGTYWLTVTGSIGGTTEVFSFESDSGEVGANAAYAFTYVANSQAYYEDTMVSVVETNNGSRIKGSFSGTMMNWSTGDEVSITEGQYDISY